MTWVDTSIPLSPEGVPETELDTDPIVYSESAKVASLRRLAVC